jgi:hypothetical protein
MTSCFRLIAAILPAMVPLGLAIAPADATTLKFSFQFDAPDFSKPELDPLEQLFSSNGITQVTGMLAYDSNDTGSVTSNFSFMSNIDYLFEQPPGELVFSGGILNQVRSWETHIAGVRYILELTGLDPTDGVHPNEWFGGMVLDVPEISVYELTAAGGGLTPEPVPVPPALPLLLGGLGGLMAIGLRRST